jgi:hypothetical protein
MSCVADLSRHMGRLVQTTLHKTLPPCRTVMIQADLPRTKTKMALEVDKCRRPPHLPVNFSPHSSQILTSHNVRCIQLAGFPQADQLRQAAGPLIRGGGVFIKR